MVSFAHICSIGGDGDVFAGKPVIVGEKRPELFVPRQSGKIIPFVPNQTSSSTVLHDNSSLSITFTEGETNRMAKMKKQELAVMIDEIIRDRSSRKLNELAKKVNAA